jgi:S-DNA-T family DNA segregation ATPase FtsK/SpoIIIE
MPRTAMPRVDAGVTWIGFALILASSMGLEAIRMYSLHMKLPRAPGGVLGDLIGGAMQHSLGFTGGTLALLFAFLVGLSLFFHFSWLNLAEQIGAGVEMLFVGFKTRRESKQDRAIGEAAKVEREEVVETRRVRIEESPPPPALPRRNP